MAVPRRLRIAFLWVLAVTATGTLGYIIAGASFLDALYMTVTTLATVGYREVVPLGPGGQVFTMGLIAVGVGSVLYLLTAVAETVVEGQLREHLGRTSMQRKIESLENHVVICGFGRFGRVVAEELRRNGVPLVIIDQNPALEVELQRFDTPYVIGSALSDDVLDEARIGRARALVVGTGSDSDNVFITLSAREKNPALRIHARGESEAGLRRLRLAGADQTMSAYQTGGLRVAASILRPAVVDFLEISSPGRGEAIDLEEVQIADGSPICGVAMQAIEQRFARLRVVALKREGASIELIPSGSITASAGDLLVVIGDRASLDSLARECGPRSPA